MKPFTRQKSPSAQPADVNIDFGAAFAQAARVFEPDVYNLQIKAASAMKNQSGNVFVRLDVVELESDARVSMQPLWVHGPNAGAGVLATENQNLIGRLLQAAGHPLSGNVGELIPKLAGLEFTARLAIFDDSRTGRTFNALVEIIEEGDL